MKEALLYETFPGGKVKCHTCQRRCVIGQGQRGYCGTRINEEGILFTLIYGEVSSISVNPIEKKPVFHFYPGSRWLSLGTLGCNFRCPGCQNWEISHTTPGQMFRKTCFVSPGELVDLAQKYDCLGISWTFNEPAIWLEYTLDGARLAKERGLFTNYVTNGYITPEALDLIGPYLDVFRVDLKGFSQDAYRRLAHVKDFSGILNVTKRAKEKWGMWVEVVTNIIPGYNDAEEELRGIPSWIKKELGELTPWHVTRFFPHLKLSHIEPTPISTLENARRMGQKEDLKYVYLGNVPGHIGENTYCHECGKLLIQRNVFDIVHYKIKEGKCPYCYTSFPGKLSSWTQIWEKQRQRLSVKRLN